MTRKSQKKWDANQEGLYFVALGGLGEIGMNVYLYGLGLPDNRQWLMVDLGLTYPSFDEPGVDVVLPDLSFVTGDEQELAGIVITHAHEDHIGALMDLWPELRVPIYATPFTLSMLKSKQNRYAVGYDQLPLNEIPQGGRVQIGAFNVEFISIIHSIPESSALVIRTPQGLIFHTGDWKFDPREMTESEKLPNGENKNAFENLADERVRALVCDSTNVLRDGFSPPHFEVERSLIDVVRSAKGCVAVTTFSSNVERIRAISVAARESGRKMVVAGRALHRVINVALQTGYLPKNFQYLGPDMFVHMDRKKVLLLCSGSQGEFGSALERISRGRYPSVKLGKGDLVVFSSRNIPGNEKAIGRVQNGLSLLGCQILTDSDALIHVTGHPRRGELKKLYDFLKPEVLVPMHGEFRHLRHHLNFSQECGVPESILAVNGQVIRLVPEPARIVESVHTGRKFRDGNLIVDQNEGVVLRRWKQSLEGLVSVSLVLSRSGDMLCAPQVALSGVPERTFGGKSMEDIILEAMTERLYDLSVSSCRNIDTLKRAVRKIVRGTVMGQWGKRPIVQVLISYVVPMNQKGFFEKY